MQLDVIDAVSLRWSDEGRVTEVTGAASNVLRREAASLVGRPLSEALGINEERSQALIQKARAASDPTVEFVRARFREPAATLRVVLCPRDAQMVVMDFDALVTGAPPVQVSRLSSSLSHEIRNPLSSVKMAVQTLARNQNLSERDQRRLHIANREIRTMERMLWLFSEYGRDTPPHLDRVPLRSLFQEAVSMIEPELAERRITVAISGAEGGDAVSLDAGRLRPVLAQVLLNIAMGLPEGDAVQVRIRSEAPHCNVELVDPTAAIPPEEERTLFEPFGSRLARGAGLSLAALRRVMQGLGGDVKAQGGAEPGITFTLSFPC